MAEANSTAPKQPKVVNKAGTLKMSDDVAATKQTRDMAGRPMRRNNRRDRVRGEAAPKEFEEITINIDRVSRTVKGGRRMRFKALVAIGNKKNKVGVGVAKGADVTAAVQKATRVAKKHGHLPHVWRNYLPRSGNQSYRCSRFDEASRSWYWYYRW